jgi:hypothetical protein
MLWNNLQSGNFGISLRLTRCHADSCYCENRSSAAGTIRSPALPFQHRGDICRWQAMTVSKHPGAGVSASAHSGIGASSGLLVCCLAPDYDHIRGLLRSAAPRLSATPMPASATSLDQQAWGRAPPSGNTHLPSFGNRACPCASSRTANTQAREEFPRAPGAPLSPRAEWAPVFQKAAKAAETGAETFALTRVR